MSKPMNEAQVGRRICAACMNMVIACGDAIQVHSTARTPDTTNKDQLNGVDDVHPRFTIFPVVDEVPELAPDPVARRFSATQVPGLVRGAAYPRPIARARIIRPAVSQQNRADDRLRAIANWSQILTPRPGDAPDRRGRPARPTTMRSARAGSLRPHDSPRQWLPGAASARGTPRPPITARISR